jgi:hypothetical protein
MQALFAFLQDGVWSSIGSSCQHPTLSGEWHGDAGRLFTVTGRYHARSPGKGRAAIFRKDKNRHSLPKGS